MVRSWLDARAVTGVVLAVLTGGLSACAGHATAAKSATAVGCRQLDPGVSAHEIRVGAIYPTSGPDGAFFEAAGKGMAARIAVENAAGGIGGRHLTLVSADDGDGQLANLTAARTLVDTDHVFGVIETTISGDGSGDYLHSQGIPVTGWGITTAWGKYLNMFGYRYSTSPKPGGEPVTQTAAFIRAHGGHRVAVLGEGQVASVNVADQVAATVPALGLQLAYKSDNLPIGNKDWAPVVGAIKASGADALFLGTALADSTGLLEAAAAAGLQFAVVILPEGYDARVAAVAPSALDRAYFVIDWRPFELPVPVDDTFRQALKQVDPAEYPGQLAMVGWLSADVFIRGLKEAGPTCPTRQAFITNLRLVTDYTADGLLPPTNFGQLFAKMPLCFYYVQLVGHRFIPSGDQPWCGVLLKDYKA
jgi:ABC-type branched-subunit amino acid transport system substrate-binding protein